MKAHTKTEALTTVRKNMKEVPNVIKVAVYNESKVYSYNYSGARIVEKLSDVVNLEVVNPEDANFLYGPLQWLENVTLHSNLEYEDIVAFTMNETTRMSRTQLLALHGLRAVIVPSLWCASCFSAQGIDTPI
jgi:hypothetical protein